MELCPTLAELYVIAQNIFQNLSPEVFDRVGNVSTYKDLIKLLHVYILPEIEFDHKHETFVQKVINQIEKEVENIEMLIKMNVQSKKNIEESLVKQRRDLLSDDGVLNILSDPSSDNDVIKLLIRHTEKDVRTLEDTLSILTDKITQMKNATDAESVKVLSVTRAERDRVVKEKEGIIRSREELVNEILQRQATPSKHLKKSTFKRRSRSVCHECVSDRFQLYERGTTELEKLSNDIKQHINTKIRLSSVREAVSLTLREVKSDGSSFGYNRKKGSLEVETDLFDSTKKPEDWKTLNEHVTMFLQTNQCDFRSKHQQFCTRIKENCKALKEQATEDYLISRGSMLLAFTVGSLPLENSKSMRFSTRWLYGSVSKEDCEALCKQISEHITDMADEIAREIQGNNEILKSFHSQVYICYEEHVSTELMPVLSELYEQSFRSQAQKLSTWIKEYSATELDSINKTMKSLFPDTDDWEPNNDHVQRSGTRLTRSTSFIDTVFGGYDKTSGSLTERLDNTLNFFLRRDRETVSNPSPQTGQSKLSSQFTSAFGDFFTNIREEDGAASIFRKLRYLTNAVQSAQKTFSELVTRNGKTGDLCADDILDILILLICRLDPEGLLKLYAHVNLIDHLSPYFLEGNINEYALVSLKGAYQHLFERQEMHTADSLKQSTFIAITNTCR